MKRIETTYTNGFLIKNSKNLFVVNLSQQSNGLMNLIKEKNTIIGSIYNIYTYKYETVEYLISLNIKNDPDFDKIINILINQQFGYYSKDKQMILNFVKTNNLTKYLIYN